MNLNMKKTIYYIFIATVLAITGCTNDDYVDGSTENISTKDSIFIFQERNPSLPDVRTKPVLLTGKNRTRSFDENGAIIGNSDALLGYSYSAGNSILGDFENIGGMVVDMDILKKNENPKDYITPHSLRFFYPERFSYSSFDSYEEQLHKMKKVSSGFNINVMNVFKIGRKKTTIQIFDSHLMNNSEVVYGELNLFFRNSSFTLLTSDAALKRYARSYVSVGFLRGLFESTMKNILDTYGQFVLTGYVTGGKAFAMFAGQKYKETTYEAVKDSMKSAMDASFAYKDNDGVMTDSVKGSLKFGNKKTFSHSVKTKFGMSEIMTKLWLYGGDATTGSMNSSDSIENIEINLTPWIKSLSESGKHTIIDITENGLIPISKFVLEENFRKRLDYTTLSILPNRTSLAQPYIEISRVFARYDSNGDGLYFVAPVLNTRQGDKIILRKCDVSNISDAELRKNEDDEVFMKQAREIAENQKQFFELKIISNSSAYLNPIISNPLCIDLGFFNEKDMFKFTNPMTGVQYIYDRNRKIAFSHLTDNVDGDWILDEYGIRDWIESLPTKSISMASIANSYRIIGL